MLKIILSTLTLSIVLLGCQGNNPFDRNSDPIEDYPAFKSDSAVQTAPPVEPEVVPEAPQQVAPDTFVITVDNHPEGRPLSFTAGVAGEYILEVRNKVDETVFSLKLSKNIDGSNLGTCVAELPCLEEIEPGVDQKKYKLSWTPRLDDAVNDKILQLQVQFVVEDDSSEAAKAAHIMEPFKDLFLDVSFLDQAPQITSIEELSGENVVFKESEGLQDVTVQVYDPNSSEKYVPKLVLDPSNQASASQKQFPATSHLVAQYRTLEKKGDVWEGRFKLNIKGIAQAYRDMGGKDSKFTANISVVASSSASGKTTTYTRSFVVEQQAQGGN